MYSLYRYFKPVAKKLPDPDGPLLKSIPPSSIQAANDAYIEASGHSQSSKRGSYVRLTGVQQAEISKYALAYGNKAAISHYSKRFCVDIPKSSVSTWKAKYISELNRKRAIEDFEPSGEILIQSLPSKKRGRPLLLGSELDEQVKSYIKDVREKGGGIDTTVLIASAEAMVKKVDKNLLKDYGGPIDLTPTWAKSLLHRIGYVKRKASTSAKVEPSNFEEMKEQYLLDIQAAVDIADIPMDLVLNWDHTGVNIVPGSQWTMAEKGAKRVECAGVDDKRQITIVVCGTASGVFLPFQVIYKGKTPACLPRFVFPADWNVTFTENHWSNEEKTLEYIHKVILPFIQKKRNDLKLPVDHGALVIYDEFRGQLTDAVHLLLDANHIYVVKVPPNCTDRLQPMDLTVNRSIKEFLRRKFRVWYSEEVTRKLAANDTSIVDTKMSTMKPLGASWLKSLLGAKYGTSRKWF